MVSFSKLGHPVERAIAADDLVASVEVHVGMGEDEPHRIQRNAAQGLVVEAGPREAREHPSAAERLGPLGVDGAGRDRGPHGGGALEPERLPAARCAERNVRDGGAHRVGEKGDDGGVALDGRGDEVDPWTEIAGLGELAGAAEKERVVTLPEDEEVGETCLRGPARGVGPR